MCLFIEKPPFASQNYPATAVVQIQVNNKKGIYLVISFFI